MNNLKNRIKRKVRRSNSPVFMIDDFIRLSKDKNQIQRALRELVSDGVVVRVGKGIYVRTRISSLTGNLIPDMGLRRIAEEVIKKNGGLVMLTKEQLAYNEKRSTQVPNTWIVGTNKRISRKINFEGANIQYVTVK